VRTRHRTPLAWPQRRAEGVILGWGDIEDDSGGGEEGEEVRSLEESEARWSRRRYWEVVPSVEEVTSTLSSELMGMKSKWEMAECGRIKTMRMRAMSKAP
jgi:hypothetical protein